MEPKLNSLEAQNLLRQIAYLKSQVELLMSYYQGRKIPSLKIGDISADKITSGTLKVTEYVYITDGTNNRIRLGKLS